ncbi:hypothetical protein ACCO45_008763 [Purpureocillium lilacinum]|uniref:Uncharacterized protein n=1 Tax=Purpureocillium lilacinum TaxID=33203 RepID=A0ACC4DIF5_PURLI
MGDEDDAASTSSAPRGDLAQAPRLGNFDKLQCRTVSLLVPALTSDARTSSSSARADGSLGTPAPLASPLKLGDFRRIVSLLKVGDGMKAHRERSLLDSQELQQPASIEHAAPPPTPPPRSIPIPPRSAGNGHRLAGSETDAPLATDPETESGSSHATLDASSTPGTTPPDPEFGSARRYALSQLPSAKRTAARPCALEQILSYQMTKYGPLIPVYGRAVSRAQRHKSLTNGLVRHRALDAENALLFPATASNGVHVLRGRGRSLRTSPPLDLPFLTEILVRGRSAMSLNVGCSVPPGRAEPRFVQELRALGYHIDLRERKRVLEPSAPRRTHRGQAPATFATSSSDEMSSATAAAATVRYVEDLVDEVLQTRIAESVMEFFQRQGTLVLATGDAQPAKHSDGFLTYANRALKMGWNVEVVSWKNSLSSHWQNPAWNTKWGNRFRIIELDPFLDELLACPTTSVRSSSITGALSRGVV